MNIHKKDILSILLVAVFLSFGFISETSAAEKDLWQRVSKDSLKPGKGAKVLPNKYLVYRLNETLFSTIKNSAPMEFTDAAKENRVILEIPNPDGKIVRFRLEESPILSGDATRQFPDWKTFSGQGIDDPTAVARFSWTIAGFRGYVMGINGTYLIDPLNKNERENYMVYYKTDFPKARGQFHCKLDEKLAKSGNRKDFMSGTPANFSRGGTLRTYDAAIATTAEYTATFANQAAAFADVMAAINRINTVYRRDFTVALNLISTTASVYTNPATDPYDNTDSVAQLTINHNNLNTVYGNANYDIGHLFGTGGGGVASSPSVCDNAAKGEGYSARVPATGDPFWVDYVAHEMGHQLAADHTYNTLETGQVCSTRSATDAFEVASGVTIMSYVGICNDRNVQQFAIDNFHARSLTSITGYLDTGQGGTTCGATTATGNSPPVPNAGADFTIPALTPFTLTGSATDANDPAGQLTYSWEQYDLAPSASGPNGTPANTYDVDTDGILRPLFRNYAPTTSPMRTFPSLTYILNNDNTPPLTYMGTSPTGAVCETGLTCVTGENQASQARTMNFRLVVRDNNGVGGGVADDAMTVTTVNTGAPFKVTAQDSLFIAPDWQANTMQTVTWNVAGTTAAPISTANVNILLSTDGGQTFPTTLVANTPNDGTQQVLVPNSPTTTARIKVEAVGNIFFDINNVNFTITAPVAADVSVSGRVLTSSGRAIPGAVVKLNDPLGGVRRTRANMFGYFKFEGIEAGQSYVFSVSARKYQFVPQIITISENITDLDLIAN